MKFNVYTTILYEMPFSRKSQYNTQSYLVGVFLSRCVNPQEVLKYFTTCSDTKGAEDCRCRSSRIKCTNQASLSSIWMDHLA